MNTISHHSEWYTETRAWSWIIESPMQNLKSSFRSWSICIVFSLVFSFIFLLYFLGYTSHKKSWCVKLVGRQTSRKIIWEVGRTFPSSIIYNEEYLTSRKISIVQYLLHFLWISQFSSLIYVCYNSSSIFI